VFVPLFRNRGLYDPTSLVNWHLQTRKIIVLWTMTLLIFTGATFAFKIGPDFSRGAVLSFHIAGLALLLPCFGSSVVPSGNAGYRRILAHVADLKSTVLDQVPKRMASYLEVPGRNGCAL